jgi:hypothetical protein
MWVGGPKLLLVSKKVVTIFDDHSDSEPSSALRYFAERLRPKWAMQVARRGHTRILGGIRVLPAERFLAWI